jgi:2-iminobutanoate/2-iminopropanoate deaminase
MNSVSTINPSVFGPPLFPYSQGAVANGLVFIAGQAALDKDNNIISPGDAYGQTKAILERIKIILAEAGAGLDDIASVTFFVTEFEHTTGFNKAWVEEFGDHRPPRAGIITKLLLDEAAVIEVQAIATLPEDNHG